MDKSVKQLICVLLFAFTCGVSLVVHRLLSLYGVCILVFNVVENAYLYLACSVMLILVNGNGYLLGGVSIKL